ncbi:ribosomal-processing cysteine protease Prp [Aquibacillus sp. 3ASR75-11]|uniref:Ribosomal processing cysteine protease Prp n=1 Tax=Terrihalobacillus insolitus TaxID=2950438 RepID=A0A9X3WS80_9BACI|nr:ribosomal-processing cysteine protease Prp [Terrihalobacillus insolitus]MDC3412463.1 ribosomal-processing cysteine protease Prp [Terrihalobacillus insolitus]MDC3423883.1 ribosomal-processing cysteine protease Prp [Terrihalobacillus insolitus]
MIKVTAYRKSGKMYAFELSGHASSGPAGHDLVCAGVSAVSFGGINAVIKLCQFEPIINQAGNEGGYLRMELPEHITDDIRSKAEWLLEGMMVSLQTIERDYGQYISISEK